LRVCGLSYDLCYQKHGQDFNFQLKEKNHGREKHKAVTTVILLILRDNVFYIDLSHKNLSCDNLKST